MKLGVQQGLVNAASDLQQGQLQAVVPNHGMGQLLQQTCIPPPGLIQLWHASQAASHYV